MAAAAFLTEEDFEQINWSIGKIGLYMSLRHAQTFYQLDNLSLCFMCTNDTYNRLENTSYVGVAFIMIVDRDGITVKALAG